MRRTEDTHMDSLAFINFSTNMTKHPKTLQEALEMFDEKFPDGTFGVKWDFDGSFHSCWLTTPDIKSFITTVWHAGRGSVVETVEGMMVKKCVKGHDNVAQCIMQECEINNHSYNSALTDVITKLSELKK